MIVCTYNGRFYNVGDAFTVPNVNPGQADRTRKALIEGGFTIAESRRGNRTTFTAVCE